ncbi:MULTISPECIES: porin [Deefgea]|uniref:Porin n=1 Tax=Deefgea chitinilytica TaxID=570276 RepID=A0ABS2CHE2_9NEIS|nr:MULTISPECIES: porin [Deefgea]MBM5572796.1 porin [Deefgea chitinilytica]MBM9890033.1 porin [Deefgea sp. CFH1-16]
MYKIIALSIAAAMASTAVNAEVTISGSIRTAFEYSNPDNVGTTSKTAKNDGSSKTQLVDQGSRIRFSGKDKLDFGGELVWVLENRFYVGDPYQKTSGAVWGSRDTYVGYKGDFGFGRFGKMDNAYKAAYKNIAPTIEGSINDTSSYMGTSQMLRRVGSRDGQVVYYETPNFNGFGAHGSWSIGDQTAAYDAHTYQLAAFWSNSMFNVGAAYSLSKDQTSDYKSSKISLKPASNGADVSSYMIGANAKYMDFGLGLTYENLTRDDGKKSRDQDSFAVAASYKLDKFNFLVTYVNVGDVDTLADSGGDQLSLGATYNLSKKSRIYATYTMLNNDKHASFTTESGYTVNNGQSVDLFSVGVRTDF